MNLHFPRLSLVLLLLATASANAEPKLAPPAPYDPLAVPAAALPKPLDLTAHDAARNRDIPVRVYLPAQVDPAPVILFSHGLGGSREGSVFLGQHWAARGYVAVFLQHPGSDTGVWKDKPMLERMHAMKQAASAENFMLRVKDVPAALDQLEAWNKADGHALKGRLDLKHIGMSGHSFGAVTTQAVSGQQFPGATSFTDPRILAAVIFSPSSAKAGGNEQAFGKVKIPWLLMTGTKDTTPITPTTVFDRQKVFPALPNGSKYEVVLDKAEHSVFTDRALPGEHEKRNPNHHRVILALSTAFWDAYLKEDEKAKGWLEGDGAKGVMEEKDGWRKK